jgi:putative oxidoreductase
MKFNVISYGSWILRGLLAVIFLNTASEKVFVDLIPIASFEGLGVGTWLLFFAGLLELSGAIALLIPSLATRAAFVLAGVMIAAILMNLSIVGGSVLTAIAILTALIAVIADGCLATRENENASLRAR